MGTMHQLSFPEENDFFAKFKFQNVFIIVFIVMRKIVANSRMCKQYFTSIPQSDIQEIGTYFHICLLIENFNCCTLTLLNIVLYVYTFL